MAIYHLSAQIIKRKDARNSVNCAAYRAGAKLRDDKTGDLFNYENKSGVDYVEIIAPDISPDWVYNRQELWSNIEHKENRKDAQLAREIEIALPEELSKEQNIELAKQFIQDNLVNNGMVADLCCHKLDSNNPHFHVMLTMRELSPEGFGKKNRDWNKPEFIEHVREQWQNYANKALKENKIEQEIDHRSLKRQKKEAIKNNETAKAVELSRQPQIHVGQARGKDRTETNKERIKEKNQFYKLAEKFRQTIKQIKKESRKKMKTKEEAKEADKEILKDTENQWQQLDNKHRPAIADRLKEQRKKRRQQNPPTSKKPAGQGKSTKTPKP